MKPIDIVYYIRVIYIYTYTFKQFNMMFFRGFTDRSNDKMNNNQHHGRDEKHDPMNINAPNLKRNTHKNRGIR